MVERALRMQAVLIGEAVTQLEARHPEFAAELQLRAPEVNWRGWKRQRGPAAHDLVTFDHDRLVRALSAAVPLLRHGLEREFGEHLADREARPDPERGLAERAARHFRLPEGQQPTGYQLNTFRWAESVAAPGILDAEPGPDLPARAAEHHGLAPGDQPTEYQLRVYAWREAVARRRPPRGSSPRRRPGRGWGREAGR